MQPNEADTGHLSDAHIVDFLRQHPDFFIQNPSLLEELNLPHSSGEAVSLVERQVAILRDRNMDMRRRMHELVQTARDNDDLFSKTRSLTLALLDARTYQELNEVLATHVLVDFDADFVCCHLQSGVRSFDHIRTHADELPLNQIIDGRRAVCTSLRLEELTALFPMAPHEESGSAVLLPLPASDGMLCIGSRDPGRFSNDMDTLFVEYIADVLSKVLRRLS
jgi:uncharacterized protein YigA (DUF484 family)